MKWVSNTSEYYNEMLDTKARKSDDSVNGHVSQVTCHRRAYE